MGLEVLFSKEQIAKRVEELGKKITLDYKGQELVAVCVLKGAFVFFADLVRAINLDLEIDFVRLSSYANQKSRTGRVIFSKDMEVPVENKHLLIIEDIVDTGHSMAYLKKVLSARGAKSVKICTLIDKRERREVEVQVDYAGFVLEKGFIVGYGLDYAEKYRNLPGVYELRE